MRIGRFFTAVTAGAITAAFVTGDARGQAAGGFLIYSDAGTFGDTDKSLAVYDPVDLLNNATAPDQLFSIFLGTEALGDTEDFADWTVDRSTGDIYVAAFDSGSTPGATTSPIGYATDGTGDIDILKINFNAAYDAWVAGGMVQTDFYSDLHNAPDPNIDINNPQDHANPVLLNGLVEKVGEVARAVPPGAGHPVEPGQAFFGQRLEFVDSNTLIMLDNTTVDFVDPMGGPDLNDPANDHEIRVIRRISGDPNDAPGFSTDAGGSNVGGSSNGTTEAWESIVIGRVNLDATFSEPEDIGYYKDPVSGVEGIWIADSDGGANGDDIAFFQITNYNGTAGNGLRPVTGSLFNGFALADDPSTNPATDDGSHDWLKVNPYTGELYIGESDFFDAPAGEPVIITQDFVTYDAAGAITLGLAEIDTLAPGIDDDDDPGMGIFNVTDGRHGTVDYVNKVAYYYDQDNAGDPSGNFLGDFYAVDLTTGATIDIGLDINNFANFPNGRWLDYFFLLRGDADDDGDVDLDDFNILAANFGQTTTRGAAVGDFDADGDTDLDDFNLLAANFGVDVSETIGGLPEPGSLALLGLGTLAVLRRRG